MAGNVDGARQTGNMCRIVFDIDAEDRCFSAHALRPDIQFVGCRKQFFFQFGVARIIIVSGFSMRCLFGKHGRIIKGSPDSYADNHWRTCIGPGILNGGKDSVFDTLDALCRLEHRDRGHILASETFCA